MERGAGLPKGAGLWKGGGGFRGRMRVGLRHCNERKTFIIVSIIIVWMCVWSGGGLRLGGEGAGLTLIHINQPKQS